MPFRKAFLTIGIALIAMLSAVQVASSTRLGLWAGSDSAVYLAAARNLLSGIGLRVIQPSGQAATLMPPLYSLALAGAGWLGLDLLEAARWLNVALGFVTILLSGWIIRSFSGTRWLSILSALLMATFPVIIEMFSGMMTEPLFLALLLFNFGALLTYAERGSHLWLAAAGLAAGLCVLTRFVGVVFLPAGALAVLLFSNPGWKRRLRGVLLFALLSGAPVAIWAIWLYINPDSSPALGRPAWSDPWVYLTPLRNRFFETLWGALPIASALPHASRMLRLVTVLVAGVIVLAPAAGAWRLYGKRFEDWLRDRDMRTASLAVLFILCFISGFILIYLFRNPPQDIDRRTLLPLFPLVLILIMNTASLWLRGLTGRVRMLAQVVCAALAAASIAAYLPANLEIVKNLHTNGMGFSAKAWQESQTVQALKDVPQDLTLISNDNGAVLYFSGRTALEMRERYRSEPLTVYTRFGDDPSEESQRLFHERRAALVVFMPELYWQLDRIYAGQAQARLDKLLEGLEPLYQGADGGIYVYPRIESAQSQ